MNTRNLIILWIGLEQIMELAIEGGILREPIDIEAFADESFATETTEKGPTSIPR